MVYARIVNCQSEPECYNAYSCASLTILVNTTNVECFGYYSCKSSTITAANSLYCHGFVLAVFIVQEYEVVTRQP